MERAAKWCEGVVSQAIMLKSSEGASRLESEGNLEINTHKVAKLRITPGAG